MLQLALLSLFVASSLGLSPQVTVSEGELEGTYIKTHGGREIAAFLGVPYAKPPLQKFRFSESVPPWPYLGTYKATNYPPPCTNIDYLFMTANLSFVYGSEDCLYLNVFTPKIPDAVSTPTTSGMNVLVLLNDGVYRLFYRGLYGPKYLLDQDIVFVTVNYRVGVMGFLSTEDDTVPGNMGLKDQVLALTWIQQNIAQFGGDPTKVTIVGLDGGAASVHYHYLSPLSSGLFRNGISISGTAICPWALTNDAALKTTTIAENLGCPTNETRLMVKCLRQRPSRSIVEMTKTFMAWMTYPFSPFGPVIEKTSGTRKGGTTFLTAHPIDLITSGQIQDLPWLVGLTPSDGLYDRNNLLDPSYAPQLDILENNWKELLPKILELNTTHLSQQLCQALDKIKAKYFQGGKINEDIMGLHELITQRLFALGIQRAARLHAEINVSPVYAYQFNYVDQNTTSEDIPGDCVDYSSRDYCHLRKRGDGDKEMVLKMTEMFLSFMNSSTPMVSKKAWASVNEGLPSFARLLIYSEGAQVELTDLAEEDYWDSLLLNEKSLPKKVPIGTGAPLKKEEL